MPYTIFVLMFSCHIFYFLFLFPPFCRRKFPLATTNVLFTSGSTHHLLKAISKWNSSIAYLLLFFCFVFNLCFTSQSSAGLDYIE